MKMVVTLGSKILVCAGAIAFTVAVGLIYKDWRPMGYLFVALALILFASTVHWYFDRRLPERKGKVLKRPGKDDLLIDVRCLKHIYGNAPIYIDVNGIRAAKIYRGNTLRIPVPAGECDISVYRFKGDDDTAKEVFAEGSALYIWMEFSKEIMSAFRFKALKADEAFDDAEIKEAYEEFDANMRSFCRLALLVGTPSMIFFIIHTFELFILV